MLSELGLASVEELFSSIPAPVRVEGVNLPAGLTEPELLSFFSGLAAQNNTAEPCFRGAGCYDHTIPSAVAALVSRSEFVTAYTPYQPEISQGTLTAIFEFQTMICSLTGLEVSNASLYDAATAACEAMMMAAVRGKVFGVSRALHPDVRETLATYARFAGIELIELEMSSVTGQTALPQQPLCGALVQSPNFFGVVEPMRELAQAIKACGGTPVALCDPLSLGLLESPGACGFDIAVGECQPLGLRMSFGGPYAGYMAVRERFLRKMPGRIVGQTVDRQNRRAFVLTLQAREQHIRRDKATSNICSNQALCALTATVWLSLMGPQGLREAAEQSAQKAAYVRGKLAEGGIEPLFTGKTFREFAVKASVPGAVKLEGLGSLIAVTEKRTREEMDAFVERAVRACR